MSKAESLKLPVGVTSGDFGIQLFDEQIRLLYRQSLAMLGVNVVVAAILVYGFMPVVSTKTLALWFGALLTVCAIRLAFYLVYKRHERSSRSSIFYARLFVVGCALSGIWWGSVGAAFFQPQAMEYQMLIFFVLSGMGAGSVASLSAYNPAFNAYFLISMVPITVRLFWEDDRTNTILAFLAILFIASLCYFAAQLNRTFVLSLKLRFENSHLVNKLREQKDEAEIANQAKSKFLAAASHDLRQPLHALTLYTSILADNLQKPQNKKLIGQINHSIEALQSLFNALLDISRLEAGTLVPERRSFRLRPMLDRVVNDFEGDAREKGIRLHIQCDEPIVFTDASLLEQIIRNYVSNAVRYTSQGSITISCENRGTDILVSVKDTGIGIPADQLDAIYGEFYQLTNPERDRSKGLGLGLAIVKRISQLLEHEISVSSSVGQGSAFSVRIPMGSKASFIDLPRASVEWMNNQAEGKSNIVIVDDDIDVRESTEALFLSWGCNVYTGATPQEALSKLSRDKVIPDAIIADYRLRGGRTGIGAIDLIKAQFGNEIPSLIITGDTASEPLQAIQNSGIPLINKPVSPAKLRSFLISIQAKEASA